MRFNSTFVKKNLCVENTGRYIISLTTVTLKGSKGCNMYFHLYNFISELLAKNELFL